MVQYQWNPLCSCVEHTPSWEWEVGAPAMWPRRGGSSAI